MIQVLERHVCSFAFATTHGHHLCSSGSPSVSTSRPVLLNWMGSISNYKSYVHIVSDSFAHISRCCCRSGTLLDSNGLERSSLNITPEQWVFSSSMMSQTNRRSKVSRLPGLLWQFYIWLTRYPFVARRYQKTRFRGREHDSYRQQIR